MKNKKTCVQCGEQLETYDGSIIFIHVCVNHKCPNYALLTIPLEDMTQK